MADETKKQCPQCNGQIDFFGSCRKCGRQWSEDLELGEKAFGLPEGEQYKSVVKKIGPHTPRKNRFTKSKGALAGKDFKTFAPEVPLKYQNWQINATDDVTEIVKKRALMRLDSRKLYSALGLSVRASDCQKATLSSLSRMWEFLDEEERKIITPTMERLKITLGEIQKVCEKKIIETSEMEKALEKARMSARKARVRIATDEQKAQIAAKLIIPGEDTEGLSDPEPQNISPSALLEQAKEKLLALDKEKNLKKGQDESTEE
jgi:hypothetical protein